MSKPIKKPSKPKEFSVIYGDKLHIESAEPNKCPVCGSESISYGDLEGEFDGNKVYFEAWCDKGHTFEEWYELTFIESVKKED